MLVPQQYYSNQPPTVTPETILNVTAIKFFPEHLFVAFSPSITAALVDGGGASF